ncbi:MAG TPA: hypothetical protein VHZ33_28060 [Trebonia sp.]|jgi:hypothetical protein|nr:hypothetical protein [Trebonia sp.]
MTTPEDNGTGLRDLAAEVSTELAQAEQVEQTEQDTDAQRYEIRLRSLLGAVSALERDPSIPTS